VDRQPAIRLSQSFSQFHVRLVVGEPEPNFGDAQSDIRERQRSLLNIEERTFMETTRKRLLYIMVGFTFGQLLIGAKPLAAQGNCQLVFDAMSKAFDTPTHLYATMNMGGATQPLESIYAAGVIYVKSGGKWGPSPISMQETKELEQKNIQTAKSTCRYLHDESVNGELAAVYSMHEETPKGKSDSQVWISKAKGLPLRSETDFGDKNHVSTRYEYGNVKPPM